MAPIFPLIAGAGENVELEFHFVCRYVNKTGSCCKPEATLYISYGDGDDFTPLALTEEDHDSLRVLSVALPASDESGRPLRRYYLQVSDPQVGLDIRYPTAGAMELFVVSELIVVDLPAQKPVETGELALGLPWGDGSEDISWRSRDGYPWLEGPLAMDVTDDGKIALLDKVSSEYCSLSQAKKVSRPFPCLLLHVAAQTYNSTKMGKLPCSTR